MKKLLAFLLGCVPALAGAVQGPYECEYGVSCEVPLVLYEPDGVLPFAGTAPNPTTDFFIHCPSTDTETTTGVTATSKNGTYGFSFVLGSAPMVCNRIRVLVRDADGPGNDYLTTSVAIETCGDASANKQYCSSEIPTLITSDGNPINATAGVIDSVTTVATTTTNADMRGTDSAALAATALNNTIWTNQRAANLDNLDTVVSTRSSHAPSDIVTAGAINTSGGAVTTVTNATNLESLNANAQGQVTAAATQSSSNLRLDELMSTGLSAQPAAGSLHGDLTEDDPGAPGTQRFTAAALAQAPSGGGGGDVNVNSWGGVLLSTTNPLPNAAPGDDGGLSTVNALGQQVQPVVVAQNNDKGGYTATVSAYDGGLSFNANQVAQILAEALNALDSRRLNELMSSALSAQPAPGSLAGDLTQDSTTIPGTQQFTADALAQAPTAAQLDAEQLRNALGGFSGLIVTVVNDQNFVLDSGPTAADSINDEFTAIFEDASDLDLPVCHRQVVDWTVGKQLVINKACPAAYTPANGDRVIVLPNGAGDAIAAINVNNGQVETDLTVDVDGTLSLGCMLSAINAVQTGAQTVVGGTDYTYRNPGDTEDRVVATRTASGRTQATITCPAGL